MNYFNLHRTHRILLSQKSDRLILIMLYILGLRISELVGLNWSDFQPTTPEEVAVTILGKGSKTRTLLIGQLLYSELRQLPKSDKCEALFISRFKNRHNIRRSSVICLTLNSDNSNL